MYLEHTQKASAKGTTKLSEIFQSGKLLWELLYLDNLVTIELHKNSLGGRLTINPIFYFVSIRRFLANFPVRTSQRRDYHFAIHPNPRPLIPDRILNFRGPSIHPPPRPRIAALKIQN